MQKEEARRFMQNASVIFLCSGYPILQNGFFGGTSAGALYIAAKWLSTDNSGDEAETSTVYEGIGSDHFAYESHSQRDYATLVQGYLFP